MLALFLASVGAAKATGAWTFLIKVFMNSWKRSLFGGAIEAEIGAEAEAGARLKAGASKPGTGDLIASFPCQTGGIVTREWSRAGTKRRAKTKKEELLRLPNGLAEVLRESF